MKAKYIILSLIASLAVLVSCEKEAAHYLDEVTVSSSYVGVPVDGGSATITVNATSAWSIESEAAWLTVSPMSGTAGETTVTFSAPEAIDGREATVALVCDGARQLINVIQGVATVSPATCAEVIAGPDSKTYRVTGICTRIANTQYGNWYLDDGTGEVYIYGTVNASGKYDWANFNIEVGDEVTVEGPKTTYNGTVELVDAVFVSVSKSLIKVAATDPEDAVIPAAGGQITIELENKGNGLYVEVPEAAKSWLSLVAVNGSTVTFSASANTSGPRDVTLVFSTTDGKANYTASADIVQMGTLGTKENPFSVTEAIAYIAARGKDTLVDVYVKGVVSKVLDAFSAQYGNASFWISEDGTYNDDLKLDFEAYRVLWLGNKKWAEGETRNVAVGDEVVLYGGLTLYKNTAETVSGKAYVWSHNGKTE